MGIEEGNTVLDVGCGTGRLASTWVSDKVGTSRQGHRLGPFEATHKDGMREVDTGTQDEHLASGSGGDAEDLSVFPEGSFDGVYLSSVLHWITEKERALSRYTGSSGREAG